MLDTHNTPPTEITAFRQAVHERRAYRPLEVKIKLIFGCNLRCQMCNHWRYHVQRPLDAARWHTLLDELAALGCRKVHFSGGEALLLPHLADLIAHAHQLGLRVNLTTNGTLIDKPQAQALVAAGLRVVIVSLDGPTAKVHDEVRGVPGAWKRTTRAIYELQRAARRGKLMIRVNTVVSRLNYRSLPDLPDLLHELGAQQLTLLPVNDWDGRNLKLQPPQLYIYQTEIAPHLAARGLELGLFDTTRAAYPFGETLERATQSAISGLYADGWYTEHPCFAPWVHSLIDYNGLVYPCCLTRAQTAPLGDLKQQAFADIWNGPAYQALRTQMHPPELPLCHHCDEMLDQNRALLALSQEPD